MNWIILKINNKLLNSDNNYILNYNFKNLNDIYVCTSNTILVDS